MTMSIQYAAGFFDGEGSVTISLYHPKNSPIPVPHVRLAVSNYIVEPITLMRRRWGGSVHIAKRGDVWTLNLNGDDAHRFLRDVYPYLIVKREAAAAALEMFRHMDNLEKRLECAVAIMDATRKGYKAKRSDQTYNACKAGLEAVRERTQR